MWSFWKMRRRPVSVVKVALKLSCWFCPEWTSIGPGHNSHRLPCWTLVNATAARLCGAPKYESQIVQFFYDPIYSPCRFNMGTGVMHQDLEVSDAIDVVVFDGEVVDSVSSWNEFLSGYRNRGIESLEGISEVDVFGANPRFIANSIELVGRSWAKCRRAIRGVE